MGYSVLILLLVSLYLIHLTLICVFSVHMHVYVDLKKCPSADFGVFKYAWAVTLKVWNETENGVWRSRVWITHRFWATCRKVLDKNRLDFKAPRLRIRQSNRKREIETRSHLSRISWERHLHALRHVSDLASLQPSQIQSYRFSPKKHFWPGRKHNRTRIKDTPTLLVTFAANGKLKFSILATSR